MPEVTFLFGKFNVQVMHDPLPKWGQPKYEEFRAACGGKFPEGISFGKDSSIVAGVTEEDAVSRAESLREILVSIGLEAELI